MTENFAEKLKELHNQRILAYRNAQWKHVLELTEQIFQIKSNDPMAAHDSCVAYFRLGDRDNARSLAQKTCQYFLKDKATFPVEHQIERMMTLMTVGKVSPRYMRHYEVLAEILYEEGAFEAARDYFEQLTLMKGKFSRKYIYLMKCNLHLEDYEKAAPLYNRMVDEFSGREGHMLISFREYLTRHPDENEAVDLYFDFLDQANLHDKELARVCAAYEERSKNKENNAILRALARREGDPVEELRLLEELLSYDPENSRAHLGLSRLFLSSNQHKGMKSLIRSLQLDKKNINHARPIIKQYLQEADRDVQENVCKGLLAILEDNVARDLMLDLSADLPDCDLLVELRNEWAGKTTDTETESMNNVTLMLENLSLGDLIRNKMRLEEHISSKMEKTSFLVTDVVGSTRLKDGVNQENVFVTFDAYHKFIDRIVKSNGGSNFIDEGDGKISRFGRAVDAVRAAREMLKELETFNQKDNKLGTSIVIRSGIHTGQSLMEDSNKANYKQVADRVLDVSCHLEKYGEPGEIHISDEVMKEAELSDEEITFLGWREKSGVNVYKVN